MKRRRLSELTDPIRGGSVRVDRSRGIALIRTPDGLYSAVQARVMAESAAFDAP